jgi:DNA-binding transcriptional ArsR family regulator
MNSDNVRHVWPDDPRIPLLRELAEPLRLQVVDRLGHQGPATVSELARELEVPMPQLSNHLRRLRMAGLVTSRRLGRSVQYELADPGLHALLPLLDRLTARVAPAPIPRGSTDAAGRACYSHLAGRLGVGLYQQLLASRAIEAQPDGTVRVGANVRMLESLGIDAGEIETGRRRFAFECLDAAEHAGHLAGALGDAVAESLESRRWIVRHHESRDVDLSPKGARALRDTLGLELAHSRPRGTRP